VRCSTFGTTLNRMRIPIPPFDNDSVIRPLRQAFDIHEDRRRHWRIITRNLTKCASQTPMAQCVGIVVFCCVTGQAPVGREAPVTIEMPPLRLACILSPDMQSITSAKFPGAAVQRQRLGVWEGCAQPRGRDRARGSWNNTSSAPAHPHTAQKAAIAQGQQPPR